MTLRILEKNASLNIALKNIMTNSYTTCKGTQCVIWVVSSKKRSQPKIFSLVIALNRFSLQLFTVSIYSSKILLKILAKMASILKRKYMPRTALNEDFALPSANQQFAQIMGTKGSHLHEVRTVDGGTLLVSLPAKLRKKTWVKPGDYVLVEPIEEGNKVKAEVATVLTRDHVAFLQQEGVWPEAFKQQEVKPAQDCDEEDFWRNPNRPTVSDSSDDDDECSSSSSENESDNSEDEAEDDSLSSDTKDLNISR